jgi:hypothetical protein
LFPATPNHQHHQQHQKPEPRQRLLASLLFHATPPPLSLHRTAVASLRHPSTTNITTTTRENHARSHAGGIPSSCASVVFVIAVEINILQILTSFLDEKLEGKAAVYDNGSWRNSIDGDSIGCRQYWQHKRQSQNTTW